jgi:uracil-DNA glycosylase
VKASDLPAAFATLPQAWRAVLPGWTLAAQSAVIERVAAVSHGRDIAPPDPFRALRLLAPAQVKVVIFGQDPYPGAGDADGLAFSAGQGRRPRSLQRIFDVLEADRPGWKRPGHGRLDAWAQRGVLLLNPVLTVEVGQPNSHNKCGWQALTSQIVAALTQREPSLHFLLWGAVAQSFFSDAAPAGTSPNVLRTRHPSRDTKREFMAGGSHFTATAQLVDWWGALDSRA